MSRPLTVAWFSFFPVERLPDVPEMVQRLPRVHPATWQRVLLGELEEVRDLRLHVLILRKQFPQNFSFERNGVTFHLIKTPGGWRAPSLFWVDTIKIRRVLKRIQPDVVHAWGTENGAALVASRLPYPSLVTMQGIFNWLAERVPLNRYQRLVTVLERYSLARTAVATVESSFAVEYLRKRFPRLEVRQVEHAPGAIFHEVRREPQLDPVRFVFISCFNYVKGEDLLLKALDGLCGRIAFELVVIGKPSGPEYEALRAALSPELWRRVSFRDELSSEEVAAELAKATMMVYPTRADTSPNVVKEAVVAGVPVIASAVGGLVDYVVPEKNGLLFPPESVAKCKEAIEAACQHPLFSRGLVDRDCLARTRQYLSPRKMAERFLGIYRELAIARAPGHGEGVGQRR